MDPQPADINCSPEVRIPDGLKAVHDIRLDFLKAAISKRNWFDVEWEFDRVLRSWEKIKRGSKND